MITVDLHQKGETVTSALYNLEASIKLARKDRDKVLCVIVGYGSTGGTHKIRTDIIAKLDEYLQKKYIKGYIFGEKLDIFDIMYQKCPFKDKIPQQEKYEKNRGKIYIGV